MLDVAAHMLLLERQAQIKQERPMDDSFLPLSLTVACLLRQLPAGLAPPAGILSFHQIDRLPIEILEQKLVRLLYGEGADALPPRASALLARAFEFIRAIVVYVKTTRALLELCHHHMTNQLTVTETIQALTDCVVSTLVVVDEPDVGDDMIREQQKQQSSDDGNDVEGELSDFGDQEPGDETLPKQTGGRRLRSRKRLAALSQCRSPITSQVPTAAPLTAVDPSGIMKRALARDGGDGSAIMSIMKKYPDDTRIQIHGVRALKSAIRKFPFHSSPKQSVRDVEDNSDEENKHDIQHQPIDPNESHRRDVVELVLFTMKRYPDARSLQRDALFCLLEYVSRADEHVVTIASLGGVVSIMEAMAQLPDDEEAQIAALSVLGHPRLAEESVVRVNTESRRLVMTAMRRFPFSERLQGLACLALANLSLRSDESMREIVARGGLDLVVAAMNRFCDVSLIQAAGCWLLTTVSTKGDEMLTACLDAGGLPPCEKARVRFATDARVQQHAVRAIQSLVRDLPEATNNDKMDVANAQTECCVQ